MLRCQLECSGPVSSIYGSGKWSKYGSLGDACAECERVWSCAYVVLTQNYHVASNVIRAGKPAQYGKYK